MKSSAAVILLCFSLSSEIVSLASHDSALYITSFIKKNHTIEARNLSTVDPKLFLNIKSYSGFLTVDEKYNSNLFFWYFPARPPNNKNNTPWILWLQGGPGASSMFGLFSEFGPLQWKDTNLQLRENSWNKEISLLFIDNPVGVGFSFTNHLNGTPKNLNETSHHLLSALDQFLKVFPELAAAPLYIAGESFSGRYAVDLGLKIMESERKMKFQGLILGNAILNPATIVNYTSLYYHWGMLDRKGVEEAKPFQDAYSKALKDGNSTDAANRIEQLWDKLKELSSIKNNYNALVDQDVDTSFEDFITRSDIQDALHVGSIKFTFSNKTSINLTSEFLTDMVPSVQKVLNQHRVLSYCGQLDLVVPCVETSAAMQQWRWNAADKFQAATRTAWYCGDRLAGYVKSDGYLTEALVRGAGHMAPADRPAELLQLVTSFIQSKQLPRTPTVPLPTDPLPIDSTTIKPPVTVTVQPATAKETAPGLIASVSLNVFLLVAIVVMVAVYWRKKRRNEEFYYTEDSLSDGILTMS